MLNKENLESIGECTEKLQHGPLPYKQYCNLYLGVFPVSFFPYVLASVYFL